MGRKLFKISLETAKFYRRKDQEIENANPGALETIIILFIKCLIFIDPNSFVRDQTSQLKSFHLFVLLYYHCIFACIDSTPGSQKVKKARKKKSNE